MPGASLKISKMPVVLKNLESALECNCSTHIILSKPCPDRTRPLSSGLCLLPPCFLRDGPCNELSHIGSPESGCQRISDLLAQSVSQYLAISVVLLCQACTTLFRGISIKKLAIQRFGVETKSRSVNVNLLDNTERDRLI